MAKNKVDILLDLNNAELRAKLKESQGLLQGFKTSLGGILGGAALGVSMKSLGDYALNSAKAFEQASISFNVLLGSEERAAKLVNDIQDLANVTPMTSSGLQENAKLLLNFNAVAEDEIIPTLRMLGDITGGDQVKMDSMTLAFAQCASAGRLMGQDLLQMVNAGFNPLQIISEKTDKSLADLKEEMSEGKISVDMVKQAFKDATSEGGRFYGMLEAQSKSKTGLEATKADSFEILGRTIAERALPALKEFDQAQIDAANSATEYVKTLYDWADVNNQTILIIQNMALALGSSAIGFVAVKKSVDVLSASYLVFANISGKVTYSQIALSALMRGQLKAALTAATLGVKSLNAALLANPWTWVAAVIAGIAGTFFTLKNCVESAEKAVEDINNTFDQNTSAIESNIETINRLVDVQKRTGEQEKELNKSVDELIDLYPSLEDKLTREQILRAGINKEMAKTLYLDEALKKQEGLKKQKESTDYWVAFWGRSDEFKTSRGYKATDRIGVPKALQRAQDKINKDLADVESLINKLNNDEINLGFDEETNAKTNIKSFAENNNKNAEKAQKEALALKLAQLDAEILLVKNNADEVYKLELQKIQARLNAEKQGTSAYQNILNERTQLEQQHQEQAIQLEIERYNRQAELQQKQLEQQKASLEAEKEAGNISNADYYTKLQILEDQKYSIEKQGLLKQEELYKNDLQRLEEINQEKLILEMDYQIAKDQIIADSYEAEYENWKATLGQLGESFQNSLSDFIRGNQTLKDSFLNIFSDIQAAFTKMILKMLAEQAKLSIINLAGNKGKGGWLGAIGTAASVVQKLFFADGGIVPGNYNQAVPIVAHGSEMVLNPLQQKTLWNMIAGANNTPAAGNNMAQGQSQQVIVNNITPVFQSLDPAQGQKMFTEWMKTSGVPIVKDSIKNNNHQMRDMIKGV